MRRTNTVALAALLIAGALALTGCAKWLESPNKPANDAIAVANAHLGKATTAGTAVTASATDLESIPYTKDGATRARELTAKIKADLATQQTELAAAKAAMDSIAAMEVSDELKEYAKLESTAIGTRVKVAELGTTLYEQMDKLYASIKKGTSSALDTQKIADQLATIARDITAVSELAATQSQTAAEYFATKKLGG